MNSHNAPPNQNLHTTEQLRFVCQLDYEQSFEMEKLEEIHELVRCLTNNTIFMNEHASNLFHVKCRIPEAKEELLKYIEQFMASKDEAELRRYRERITRAF